MAYTLRYYDHRGTLSHSAGGYRTLKDVQDVSEGWVQRGGNRVELDYRGFTVALNGDAWIYRGNAREMWSAPGALHEVLASIDTILADWSTAEG